MIRGQAASSEVLLGLVWREDALALARSDFT